MDQLYDQVTSISWWVGVVVVGVLVSLTAAYLKPRLDFVFSALSKSWSVRSAMRAEERRERIAKLKSTPQEQVMAGIAELRLRISAYGYLVLGIAISGGALLIREIVGSNPFVVIIELTGLIAIIMAFSNIIEAGMLASEVEEARQVE